MTRRHTSDYAAVQQHEILEVDCRPFWNQDSVPPKRWACTSVMQSRTADRLCQASVRTGHDLIGVRPCRARPACNSARRMLAVKIAARLKRPGDPPKADDRANRKGSQTRGLDAAMSPAGFRRMGGDRPCAKTTSPSCLARNRLRSNARQPGSGAAARKTSRAVFWTWSHQASQSVSLRSMSARSGTCRV